MANVDVIARGMAGYARALAKKAAESSGAISNIGRYLSTWNSTTGFPETNPDEIPYEYKTGDYYIIGHIGTPNFKPTGTSYTGDGSAEIETSDVEVSDMYYYDGSEWTLLKFSLALAPYLKVDDAAAKYLDKTNTGTEILQGKIQVGNNTTNTTNAFLHIRKVTSPVTGASVNGACFAVNGDGTASFQHKTYNDDGTGAKNSAVLRFSNQGIQFAINTGGSTSPTEAMYKDLATIDYFTGGTGIKVEDGVISLDLEAAEGVSV